MSGRFKRSWCEAGAQTPPLLRASSPLKPKNQLRTNIENWYSERGHFTILTALAPTIGKHNLYIGISYEYFDFDKIDGVDLRNFGAVFTHEQNGLSCPPGSTGCTSDGLFIFAKDVITTQNTLDLKIHEIAAVATFGITSRLDVSVVVPTLNVREALYC
jgi:hypothetical protein